MIDSDLTLAGTSQGSSLSSLLIFGHTLYREHLIFNRMKILAWFISPSELDTLNCHCKDWGLLCLPI